MRTKWWAFSLSRVKNYELQGVVNNPNCGD